MHINPHWITLSKRLASSWFSIGFWVCAQAFYLGILASLYRNRTAYAEGLMPDLLYFSGEGLLFSAARDTEHAMTVFFLLVLYSSFSVALIPFVIRFCWRLRCDLQTSTPISPR